jgi:hypothetical protein
VIKKTTSNTEKFKSLDLVHRLIFGELKASNYVCSTHGTSLIHHKSYENSKNMGPVALERYLNF